MIRALAPAVALAACSPTAPVEHAPGTSTACQESCAGDAGDAQTIHSQPAASLNDAAASLVTATADDAGAVNPLPHESDGGASTQPKYDWDLPAGFPEPAVPDDNPMSFAKVTLGRHLFYDVRLSRDDSMSCSSCHEQARAFTDGSRTSLGFSGQHTPRNSMTLANVAYASTLTWANPLLLSLERQALIPMFGDDPFELGLRSDAELETKLAAEPLYHELFQRAFPSDVAPITTRNAVFALASFQRTLISGNSPFDAFLYGGHKNAISAEARRGYELFNSEKLECFHCHVGFNLSDHVTYRDKPFIDRPYHNTGLYDTDGAGAYPEPNTGVHAVTGDAKDMGRFRAPSLRNIAVTVPYMHDVSIATLDEVLDHYAAGGRKLSSGPHAGDGSKNRFKSSLIRSFELSDQERRDVLAFLESLTDEDFLTDPKLSDPWRTAQ